MITSKDAFDAIVAKILKNTPLSSCDNLMGFEEDLDAYLFHEEVFSDIKVQREKDPQCVLVASCKASNPTVTREEAAKALERIWIEYLRYSFYEAHLVEIQNEQVAFRFITCDQPGTMCVTGKIVVTGFIGNILADPTD